MRSRAEVWETNLWNTIWSFIEFAMIEEEIKKMEPSGMDLSGKRLFLYKRKRQFFFLSIIIILFVFLGFSFLSLSAFINY